MLTPRFPRARRLVLWSSCLVWLGTVAAAGIGGCQGPDTFLRKDDGSGGVGASGFGGFIGLGGAIGLGGFVGLGGSPGIGGGGAGTGGRVGTGGRGTGGTVVVGTGGSPGTGGRDGGAPDLAGSGGRVGTGGAPGMDAGHDAEGGVVGTGPCAGLCANPIAPPGATPTSVPSTNQGVGATCYEVIGNFQGGNCGNFMAPRTLSINGVVVPTCGATTSGGNFNLPATRINGGYCFQATAGEFSYAYFGLF